MLPTNPGEIVLRPDFGCGFQRPQIRKISDSGVRIERIGNDCYRLKDMVWLRGSHLMIVRRELAKNTLGDELPPLTRKILASKSPRF